MKGIDVAGYGYTTEVDASVPLCRACFGRVRSMRGILWSLSVLAFLGVTFTLFSWGIDHDRAWVVIVAAMLFLAFSFFVGVILPQLLDLAQLRVAATTHRAGGTIVRLLFRSEESAREVERLTERRRNAAPTPREREIALEQVRRDREEAKRIPSRVMPAIFVFVGSLLYYGTSDDPVYTMPAVLIAVMGGAGLVEPRITWAFGKSGAGYPARIRLVARLVALVGFLLGVAAGLRRAGII